MREPPTVKGPCVESISTLATNLDGAVHRPDIATYNIMFKKLLLYGEGRPRTLHTSAVLE